MADRFDIVSPRAYTDRNGEVKTAFTRIGTAWAMKNGNGFSLTFDALPVPSLNDKGALEVRCLMMPPKSDDAQRSGGGYSADKTRRQAPAPSGDDIPFAPEWRG